MMKNTLDVIRSFFFFLNTFPFDIIITLMYFSPLFFFLSKLFSLFWHAHCVVCVFVCGNHYAGIACSPWAPPACQRATPNLYTEWGALSTGVLYLIVLVNSGQTMLHDWASVNSDTYIPALYSIRVSWLPLRLNNAVGWWQGKYRNKTEWKAIFKHDFTLISLHVRRRAGSYSFPSYSNSTLSLSLCQSLDCILFYSLSLQSSSQVFDELTINFKRQITWLRHWKTSSNCARIIRDRVSSIYISIRIYVYYKHWKISTCTYAEISKKISIPLEFSHKSEDQPIQFRRLIWQKKAINDQMRIV